MKNQNETTLITPVREGAEDELSLLLDQVRADVEADKKKIFANPGTIHFLRWIFINKSQVDEPFENILVSRLVFSTIYDGQEDEHFDTLTGDNPLGILMDRIYTHCTGYPEPSARNPATRKAFLLQSKVKPAAFFAGAPNRSLKQIQQEDELRKFIRATLNSARLQNASAAEICRNLRKQVFAHAEFQWAKESTILPKTNRLGMGLLSLALLVLLIPILIWLVILHFVHERKDKAIDYPRSRVSETHMQNLEQNEDLEFQNQFTQLLVMKPGKMRLITLSGMMLFARVLIKCLFVDGKLMGIPTIHFARWILFDENKHMIFFSNFDGSWQQYLGDFIDKSGWGLTGIWSNTMNFPRTRFLMWGGAYDEEHFLAWSRRYEIPTQVWYSAYPQLSIKNIINNSAIRNEVAKEMTEKEAAAFLKRF